MMWAFQCRRVTAFIGNRAVPTLPTPVVCSSSSSLLYRQPHHPQQRSVSTALGVTKDPASSAATNSDDTSFLNLSVISQGELETIVVAWGYPKYRAKQIYQWIRHQGVTDVDQMTNIPKTLRQQLSQYSQPSSLTLAQEQVSKDGTIKRAYRCVDGQVIESVLMPYQDGRYTACISSQAGCAQGCVFCATGQMGLKRQLTSNEIVEQVARFAAELQQQPNGDTKKTHGRSRRLSNIVFMGMGEPLANYRHVKTAIHRLTTEFGIGARKITVSTVGVVPKIRQLIHDEEMPQVRLAVSLHCATDAERTALLPANARYGGLDELMQVLKEYIDTTGRRLTLEWALIAGENDSTDTAQQLGRLILRHGLRRDMVHVNVIPLNPTGGFGGAPSQRRAVNAFCQTLENMSIACTPRVRRGIDIDAGCGQLTTQVLQQDEEKKNGTSEPSSNGVVAEPESVNIDDDSTLADFSLEGAVDFESDDGYEDPELDTVSQQEEAARLIALVQGKKVHPLRKDE